MDASWIGMGFGSKAKAPEKEWIHKMDIPHAMKLHITGKAFADKNTIVCSIPNKLISGTIRP